MHYKVHLSQLHTNGFAMLMYSWDKETLHAEDNQTPCPLDNAQHD